MEKRFGPRAAVTKQVHRVVVVDDHPDAAEITWMMLRAMGHICQSAVCGTQGLAIADKFHPDIVLLDIGMPDLSGYEVARKLRTTLGPTLYLAAVTGWGEAGDRERAFEAGFDHHVIKPASGAILQG